MTLSTAKPANKIIWFFIGNPVFTASSRIHAQAIHRELLRLGYNSYTAYLPEFIEQEIPFDFSQCRIFEELIEKGDLIILQKIKDPVNLKVLNYFRNLGLHVALIDCDLPASIEVGKVCDHVICTSKALRDIYLQRNINALFIEDCPEVYFESTPKKENREFTCCWFGDNTPQKWEEVARLESLFKDPRLSNWKLVTISNHPNATIQWSPNYFEVLKEADVVALPIQTQNEESSVKSANRLLQSMALSVPVICSPLPSYTDIVTPGTDAIICSADEEWIVAFKKLEDLKTREQMAKAAFATSRTFHIEKAISLWIKELSISEEFKINDRKHSSETQLRLADFFYRTLLMKNPFYWTKMRFTISNFGRLSVSLGRKLRKRFSI